MPHFTIKDLEKMITDKLDNRGLKPTSSAPADFELTVRRLREAAQRRRGITPKLPKI